MKTNKEKLSVMLFLFLMTTVGALALVKSNFYSSGPTLLQTGFGCTSNSAWSSNNFPIPYNSPPTVLCQQIGTTNSQTNTVGFVTNTYFIVTNGAVNVSNMWVAIGTPQ